jgi:prepilin-type N-terminal cleavage/methylation domain-containing protein
LVVGVEYVAVSEASYRTVTVRAGFTLLELITVILMVAVLAGLTIRVAGYVQRRTAITNARADLAAMEMSLDSFKLDQGRYPTSSITRLSYYETYQWTIWTNATLLYQQIATGPAPYHRFRPNQIQSPAQLPSSYGTIVVANDLVGIYDTWGGYWNYFNPTFFTNINPAWYSPPSCIKYNLTTYDIFSRGPDRTENTADDINNWRRE